MHSVFLCARRDLCAKAICTEERNRLEDECRLRLSHWRGVLKGDQLEVDLKVSEGKRLGHGATKENCWVSFPADSISDGQDLPEQESRGRGATKGNCQGPSPAAPSRTDRFGLSGI